jgi:O-antigen ligase/polysaccharide polymerase Wzy-like membrane protein
VGATRLRRGAGWLLALLAVSIPLSTTGMVVALVGLAAVTLLAWWAGEGVVRATPLDGVLGLFVGALVLSTLASGRPWEAATAPKIWVMIGYFVVYWWLADAGDARRFARLVVAAGTVAACYGVLQHFTGADWYRALLGREQMVHPRVEGAEGFAAIGFFRNYLTYAHVLLVPFALAVAGAAAGSGAAAATLPAFVLALAFSTARGAWIAAAAVTVASAALARRGLAVVAGAAAVAALAWIVSPGLREQAAPMLGMGGDNAARIAIVHANLDVVRDHPVFGLGFGRYQTAALPYYQRHPDADRHSHAHNNFLQMAAEAGLVGLAAFTLLFVTALRLGFETVVRTRGRPAQATALGAWLALTAFLVGGLTQYTFGDNEVAIAMWSMLAVLMRLRDAA